MSHEIEQIILFISTTSQKSMICHQAAQKYNIPLEIVRLDTIEAREKIKNGEYIRISSVPSLVIIYSDGDVEALIYLEKILQWFDYYNKLKMQGHLDSGKNSNTSTNLYGNNISENNSRKSESSQNKSNYRNSPNNKISNSQGEEPEIIDDEIDNPNGDFMSSSMEQLSMRNNSNNFSSSNEKVSKNRRQNNNFSEEEVEFFEYDRNQSEPNSNNDISHNGNKIYPGGIKNNFAKNKYSNPSVGKNFNTNQKISQHDHSTDLEHRVVNGKQNGRSSKSKNGSFQETTFDNFSKEDNIENDNFTEFPIKNLTKFVSKSAKTQNRLPKSKSKKSKKITPKELVFEDEENNINTNEHFISHEREGAAISPDGASRQKRGENKKRNEKSNNLKPTSQSNEKMQDILQKAKEMAKQREDYFEP